MDGTCSSCGTALAQADILYTEDAKVVCAKCSGKAEIKRDERRAATNIKNAAYTCLGFALAAWFINPVFLCSAISLTSGLYAVKSLLPGNERFTSYLSSSEKTVAWATAGLGLAIASFELLIILNVLSIAMSSR
jgi:predicted RNA-binding Zn-ribbon protein involved in translation (DUF1610 family)